MIKTNNMKQPIYDRLATLTIIDDNETNNELKTVKVNFLYSIDDENLNSEQRRHYRSEHFAEYNGVEKIVNLRVNTKLLITLRNNNIYEVNTDRFAVFLKRKDENSVLSYYQTFRLARDLKYATLDEDMLIKHKEMKAKFLNTFTESDYMRFAQVVTFASSNDLPCLEDTSKDSYTIYDVNGFLSCLQKDGSTIVIDAGNEDKNILGGKKYIVDYLFISHAHKDHYNLWRNLTVKEKVILPFNTGIVKAGAHHYSKDLYDLYLDNDYEKVFVYSPPKTNKKRNKLFSMKIFCSTELYYPKHGQNKNKNLDSLCLKFKVNEMTVFYPGDTMHYMYNPHLKNVTHLVASHHGGYVGKVKFKVPNPINCLYINTIRKSYLSKVFSDNLIIYQSYFTPFTRRIKIIDSYDYSAHKLF